jgi:hypothetical protein
MDDNTPRPLHFIRRVKVIEDTGEGYRLVQSELVPLVPLDILPPWIDIIGVPRELTPEQIECMAFVGNFSKPKCLLRCRIQCGSPPEPHHNPESPTKATTPTVSGSTLVASADSPSAPAQDLAAKQLAVQPTLRGDKHRDSTIASTHGESVATPIEEPGLSSQTMARPTRLPSSHEQSGNEPLPTSPSKSTPKRARGTPCPHWCRTGWCRYDPRCRFSHQMPKTLEALSEVGLGDWPRWWCKEQARKTYKSPGTEPKWLWPDGRPSRALQLDTIKFAACANGSSEGLDTAHQYNSHSQRAARGVGGEAAATDQGVAAESPLSTTKTPLVVARKEQEEDILIDLSF